MFVHHGSQAHGLDVRRREGVHKIEVSKEAVRAIDQWLSPLLRNNGTTQ